MSLKQFFSSLRHAGRGLRWALDSENNFRLHLAVAIVVVVLLLATGLDRVQAALIIFLISSILTLELVNTVVERFVDLLEPRIHPYAGLIKDLLAAAVLITAVAAIAIGLLILGPQLVQLF
ncbi:MAG: diacylglycerol kinase family protein [Candidatus Kerfeldbacteria bacterium]|nr:diacylglycerol kinase family protein [Candidatus Kerfeldbacteria bacterium]